MEHLGVVADGKCNKKCKVCGPFSSLCWLPLELNGDGSTCLWQQECIDSSNVDGWKINAVSSGKEKDIASDPTIYKDVHQYG